MNDRNTQFDAEASRIISEQLKGEGDIEKDILRNYSPTIIDNSRPLSKDEKAELNKRITALDELGNQNVQDAIKKQKEDEENARRKAMIMKAQGYALRFLKKHPNTKPERLKRIVAKKFNIKLT